MYIVLGKGQLQGPISGADETVITYAEQIKKAGHHVLVLLMYPPAPEDPYLQRLQNAGVELSYVASSLATTSLDTGRSVGRKLFNLFPASKQLIRDGSRPIITSLARRHFKDCVEFLRKENVDVLHVITPDPSAMIMIRAGHEVGVPVIYHELGLPFHPPGFETYYQQFTSVLKLCTEVAALSPSLLQRCQAELPVKDSFSILPLMSSQNGTNGKSGNDWPTRNGHVNFGFASRMEELKGPMVLMGAFGAAHRRVPNLRLQIAGEGSQKEKVSALARSLDVSADYRYSGVYTVADDRAKFLHDVDVFVLPSFTEGTPLCIIEAMANSKPIIASDVGGIPDMIDSESGILVPPGDEDALAEAMTMLAQDKERRIQMGRAARERYLRLFSTEAVVPLMLETYARLAGQPEQPSDHPWRLVVTGQ